MSIKSIVVGKLKAAYKKRVRKQMKKSIAYGHHDASTIDANVADYRKQGFSMSESANFELNKNDYRDYISTWESMLPRIDNPMSAYFPVADDKYLFYLTFSHFIKTPRCYALIQNGEVTWIDARNEKEDIYDFCLKHKKMVIKDRKGADGFSVYVFEAVDGVLHYKDKPVSRAEMTGIVSKFSNGLVQECLEQGSFANALYPRTINTVRVITIRPKDAVEHEVCAAIQRFGTSVSYPVDNFHQGGGCCLIDLETGELDEMITRSQKDDSGHYYFSDCHTDTGAQIKGKVIPHWAELKKGLIDLTRKLPFFEYIAWDIVLLDEGFAVIEINMKSSLDIFQMKHPQRHTMLGKLYREHGWLEN